MSKVFRTYYTLVIVFFAVVMVPVLVHGQPLVQCSGDACRACDLATLVNTVIGFLTRVGSIIATIVFMWAGFKLVTSGGNTESRQFAKTVLTNVIIGVILMLSGYLIVNTIMQVLVGNAFFNGAKWNTVECVANPTPSTNNNNGTLSGSANPASGVSVGQGNISQAADAYIGQSTAAGPGGGNVACAWAVNNVLQAAGVAPVDGNSVAAMENVLRNGRGDLVNQSSAMPGDVVIQAGDSHVGICQNVGCTQVISNSSSKASFSWVSGPDFSPSYSGGTGRIYRVK